MLEVLMFGVGLLSLLVAVATFVLIDPAKHQGARYGIGGFSLAFTVLFGLVGIFELARGIIEATPRPSVVQQQEGEPMISEQLAPIVPTDPPSLAPQISTDFSTRQATRPIPESSEQASTLFGGSAEDWSRFHTNGWKFSPGAASLIQWPEGWRADYTDANFAIFSCGDTYEPGVYGSAEATVIEATLWYVPGEDRCPSWTTWSQSQ